MATIQEQNFRAQALDMALRTPGVNDFKVLKLAAAYERYITSGSAVDDQAKPKDAEAKSMTVVSGTINQPAITIRDAQGNAILGAVLTLPISRPRLD